MLESFPHLDYVLVPILNRSALWEYIDEWQKCHSIWANATTIYQPQLEDCPYLVLTDASLLPEAEEEDDYAVC